jgi:hypothetical protein
MAPGSMIGQHLLLLYGPQASAAGMTWEMQILRSHLRPADSGSSHNKILQEGILSIPWDACFSILITCSNVLVMVLQKNRTNRMDTLMEKDYF